MATFKNAISNQEARTANNMKALKSSADPVVDLFYKAGASRGKNILPDFLAAYNTDEKDLALRVLLWLRDVRSGAGERKLFRDVMSYMAVKHPEDALRVITKIPELGRWDDLIFLLDIDQKIDAHVFSMFRNAFYAKNGLAAKWAPRKGIEAKKLREFLGWTPKRYRKTIVSLSNTVEQKMCSNQWENINYSHVPSKAAKIYRKAFYRHDEARYKEYVDGLKIGVTVKGEKVKVNAGAIYPHDVIKPLMEQHYGMWNRSSTTAADIKLIEAQWNALPNYINSGNILPLVDVSGSMSSMIGKGPLRAIDIAVSLGLYCADKNTGKFSDVFLTFTSSPQLVTLKGSIVDKVNQLATAQWHGSTNLHAAFDKILSVAVGNNVPAEEMPETLLILSDMQFNMCVRYDDSAIQMIRRKYEDAGYNIPKVVFWNINSHDNVPVSSHESGTALVSGFSPSVLDAILANDLEQFTPRAIVLKKIMNPRYDLPEAIDTSVISEVNKIVV